MIFLLNSVVMFLKYNLKCIVISNDLAQINFPTQLSHCRAQSLILLNLSLALTKPLIFIH